MKVQELLAGIEIISKYIPLDEMEIWRFDHYMIAITNKDYVIYTKEDMLKLDKLHFLKTCDCEEISACDCNPDFWKKFW